MVLRDVNVTAPGSRDLPLRQPVQTSSTSTPSAAMASRSPGVGARRGDQPVRPARSRRSGRARCGRSCSRRRRPPRRAREVEHRPVGVGLDLAVGGDAGAGGDPVDADERHVDVHAPSTSSASGPTSSNDAARATPPVTTRLMSERTASSAAMLIAFVTIVRSLRCSSARPTSVVVEPPVSADRHPVAHVGDRGPRDPLLLLALARGAVAHRQLVQAADRHRAAVGALDQSLLVERLQVAAHGGGGDGERRASAPRRRRCRPRRAAGGSARAARRGSSRDHALASRA